jgi:nucleoside-diphosphate-sugar epimerase
MIHSDFFTWMKNKLKYSLNFCFIFILYFSNGFAESNEKILVIGGTGRVGSEIVKALHNEYKDITVLSRSDSNRSRLKNLNIKYIKGNVLLEGDMEQVFSNVSYDVVINAIAKVGESQNPHALGQLNLSKWSKRNGIKHFILIGSVGTGPNPEHSIWRDILIAKGKAEQSLINSGLNYTIIKTGIIIYDDTSATNKAFLSNNIDIVGKVTRKDLALLTVNCILKDSCSNRIFNAMDDTL